MCNVTRLLFYLTSEKHIIFSTKLSFIITIIICSHNEMQFSVRIRMENDLFQLYKSYGSTSSFALLTLVGLELYSSPFNEMQFSDLIQMENDPFHPYKPYGSTRPVNPSMTPIRLELDSIEVPLMRCNFLTVYG